MLQAQNVHGHRKLLAENSEGEAGKLASDLDTFYFTDNSLKITENVPGRSPRPQPTHTLCKIFPTYSEDLPQTLIP